MPRSLSLNLREAINAAESGEVPIFLVTVVDPNAPGTVFRLSSDPTTRLSDVPLSYATLSRGNYYYFVPMEIAQPDERESAPPSTSIRISGFILPEMLEVLREVTEPLQVKLELVLLSALDTVEVETPWLDTVAMTGSIGEIVFELALNSMVAENLPVDNFDPASFPGLHSKL